MPVPRIAPPNPFRVQSVNFDPVAFRLLFPAFADETVWPDAVLAAYWAIAREYIGVPDSPAYALNGGALQFALNCMTAHLAMMLSTEAIEGTPEGGGSGSVSGGVAGGIITSASIGSVSVSSLPPPLKGMWDWWLGQTPYGMQLLALLNLLSVGGFYVGGLPERKAFRKVGGVFW